MKMNKLHVLLLTIISLCVTISIWAAPAPSRHHNNRPIVHNTPPKYGPRVSNIHRPPAPAHNHAKHHYDNNFWPGFVGGIIGSACVTPPPIIQTVPAPVIVPAPVLTRVWIEGRYVDTVQPNGIIIRVWQPGHYEYR